MKHEAITAQPAAAQAQTVVPSHPRIWLRRLLLTLGPVAVLAGSPAVYLLGGRTVGTDNAYVHADVVQVTAQVSGPVAHVFVRDNQHVAAGDPMFEIDRVPFEIAEREAAAALDRARSQIAALQASYRQKLSEIELAESDRAFAEREWDRQRDLAARNVASRAKLDRVRHDYDVAGRKLDMLQEDLAQIVAGLGGDPKLPADRQPAVREVRGRLEAAELNLERTAIPAPMSGVVSEAPRIGQYVATGLPILSLIGSDRLWIEANFKETALTNLKPGQAVQIAVDTYPGRHWIGQVESLAQATGAMMSVLPAQNSSGNWVKVVQRVPVRIAILVEPDAPTLRAGMSAEVSVETENQRTLAGLVRLLRSAAGF
jgi:membrane fusion protein, multidrug efflux system